MKKFHKQMFALASIAALTSAPLIGQETWGPRKGDREITLGGSGVSDTSLNDGTFGISGSWGVFMTDNWELAIRQGFSYSDFGDTNTNASTRLAADYHFQTDGNLLPFLGVNIGGIYGDSVKNTFAAGLEGGLKLYVREKTFVFAMIEYQWLFEKADGIEDTFDDGQFVYGVGIGFNY